MATKARSHQGCREKEKGDVRVLERYAVGVILSKPQTKDTSTRVSGDFQSAGPANSISRIV